MSTVNYFQTITEYVSNRFVTRTELEAKQLAKFRRLINFANLHSPYYAGLIRERQIDPDNCHPSDFPVLTKNDFIANFDQIVTDRTLTHARISRFIDTSTLCENMLDGRYYVVHSSGTSGQVSYSVFTRDEWYKGHLHFARVARRFGLGIRRRIAHVSSMDGHVHGALMSRLAQRGFNRILLNARRYDINDPIDEIVDDLNRFQPQAVSGYGGALFILAQSQEDGKLNIRPKELFYGGEPLTDEQRRYVSGIFEAPVKSVYACSEHLYMAGTIPGTDIMQMFEDNLMFEFAEDHVLITNLFNYTMPLIRHRIDDKLKPVGIKTTTHPFTLVRPFIGRQEATLWFTNPDGHQEFIHPNVIFAFFVPNVRAFQIVRMGDQRFVFRAQLDPGLTDEERAQAHDRIGEKLNEMLAQKNLTNVTFSIDEKTEIGVDPKTRKFRTILLSDDALRLH